MLGPTLIGLLAVAVGWRAMLPPLIATPPPPAERIAALQETFLATAVSQMPEGIGGSIRRQISDQLTATSTPYPTVLAGYRLEGPNVQRRAAPEAKQLRWVVTQGAQGPNGVWPHRQQ